MDAAITIRPSGGGTPVRIRVPDALRRAVAELPLGPRRTLAEAHGEDWHMVPRDELRSTLERAVQAHSRRERVQADTVPRRLTLRLTAEEWDCVGRAAEETHESVSSYVAWAAYVAACDDLGREPN